jgi:arsenite/tail-anchored protein-transporting ATPase
LAASIGAISEAVPLLARRVVFFGGKGGVGKTTIAAVFGLLAAYRNHKTLLVSTDPAHSLADIFDVRVGSEPTSVRPGLWAMELDPTHEADRFIQDVKARIADTTPPRLATEVERQIDIARVTPGAEETAVFERFTRILEEEGERYDRVLFDTAPTGHTLRLLTLPELMSVWMSGLISRRKKVNALSRMWRRVAGAAAGDERDMEDPVLDALMERQRRFDRARRVLTDRKQTAFAFVVIPERLPILETDRAVRTLRKYDIPVAAIIVNRTLPAHIDGEFLAQRRQREQRYLETIDTTFTDLPVYRIPTLASDVVGDFDLQQVMDALPGYERGIANNEYRRNFE